MTRAEYKAYQARVAAFFEAEGIENLSSDPDSEAYFSWQSCDCCGTGLGGNREDATGYNRKTKAIHKYEVCFDCIYYAEYGRLDDMTMMDIDEETIDENLQPFTPSYKGETS
jgi:hypothetical protein